MGSKPMSEARKKELTDLIAELRKQVIATTQVISNFETELTLGTEYCTTNEELTKILSELQPDIDYAKKHGYLDTVLLKLSFGKI